MLVQVFPGDGQHAAGARRGVVDRPHHARLGQHLVVLDEEEIDHEADDLARGEVLPGGLVGDFREFPDQLLEDQSHLSVADGVGMEVDVGELFRDLIEEAVLREPLNLGEEVEPLKDVPHGWGERLDVGEEV